MNRRPKRGDNTDFARRSRPIPLEDAALVEKVNAGQPEAFGELVRKYQDRVFNTCWRICGHLEDARDVTQEAFLKAFENLGTFRQQSGFYTWIFRIAVNLALSHGRKAVRRRTESLNRNPDMSGTQAADLAQRLDGQSVADPVDCAGDAEMHAAVARALHALEEEQRAVIVLRDIEGLDYQEISVILAIPPGTVKSRLHRARMAIRQALLPRIKDDRVGE